MVNIFTSDYEVRVETSIKLDKPLVRPEIRVALIKEQPINYVDIPPMKCTKVGTHLTNFNTIYHGK